VPPADTVAYQTPGRLGQRTVWYAVPCHAGYRSHCAGYDMRPCRAGLSQQCVSYLDLLPRERPCRAGPPCRRAKDEAVPHGMPCRPSKVGKMHARARSPAPHVQPREPGPCRAYRVQVCQQWMSSMTQEERLEVSAVPAQMWAGVSAVPVQMWAGVSPVPAQMCRAG